MQYFQILAGCVKDFRRTRPRQQHLDRVPVKVRQWVDANCLFRRRHLKQTQPREEGSNPLKFCINPKPRCRLGMFDPGIKILLAVYPKWLGV